MTMRFYLGTHEVPWLARAAVPLFVSRRRLIKRRSLPRAAAAWALDSGAFTEIRQHQRFTFTVEQYVADVERYGAEIGRLDWAAPMDWMVEPEMVELTGLSVREHQERTVANYLDLRGRGPFIPVLQGWTLDDYETCVDLYRQAGVDLAEHELVGVGSVCRRQAEDEIGRIMLLLHDLGIRVHGFGVKLTGLGKYGDLMASADSMAWSFDARRAQPLHGCRHKNCANCIDYALRWRRRVDDVLGQQALFERTAA